MMVDESMMGAEGGAQVRDGGLEELVCEAVGVVAPEARSTHRTRVIDRGCGRRG